MEDGFRTAIQDWAAFYAALSAIAATLLGLLFVSVSLRLNLFRDATVQDVRDFAALVFGQYLALVLIGLFALIPHPHPATLGLPVLLLGVLGVGWSTRIGWEYARLNQAPGTQDWWTFAFYSVGVLAAIGLNVVGALPLGGREDLLPWLAAADLTMLVTASVGAWTLLSHAQPS